jgi:hypothetical protein
MKEIRVQEEPMVPPDPEPPPSFPLQEMNSNSLINQFSGEPQIVNFSSICQLTCATALPQETTLSVDHLSNPVTALDTIKEHDLGCRSSIISQRQFVEIVQTLHATASPCMNPSLFIFQLLPAAAAYNATVLAEHGFDLNRIIEQQHPSQISYGSEFRDPMLLHDLLQHHPFGLI